MTKRLLIVLIAWLLVLVPSAAAKPASQAKARTVVVLVANGVSATDLLNARIPNIRAALREGAAIGLMNARAAKGAANSPSGYLSLGMGARANAGIDGNLAADRNQALRLGNGAETFATKGAMVISPTFPEMSRKAADLGYPAVPGILGQSLRDGGVRASVYGNADALGEYHREVNLITMDERGTTEGGRVGRAIRGPEDAWRIIKRASQFPGLIALDYSPVSRLTWLRNFVGDQAMERKKRETLSGLDRLFGKLVEPGAIDRETLVLIVSPYPDPASAKAGDFQTPLVVSGGDFRGLLASASTRWPGMVTSSDVAPTILTFFGLEIPAELSGRPLFSIPASRPLEKVVALDKKAAFSYATRSTMLTTYITALIVAIAAVALSLLLFPGRGANRYWQPLLLAFLFFPMAGLAVNAVSWEAAWPILVLVPVVAVAPAIIAWLLSSARPIMAIRSTTLLTVTVILVQLPFSSFLERNSTMGMSSIIGARFYGLGNEYMGVLLAAAVIYLSSVLDPEPSSRRGNSLITVLVLAALTAVIALPGLGANIGGGLAAAVTGVVGFHLLRGGSLRPRHVAYALGAMLLVVAVVLGVELFSPNATHAGRAAAAIGENGAAQASLIIVRKLAVNFLLISRSSWTNILAASGFAIVILSLGAPALIRKVSETYPLLIAGLKTVALGAFAALVFNDSGVVAAALMVAFATCAWLYLMVELGVRSQESEVRS